MAIYAIVKNSAVSNLVLANSARDESWVDVTETTPKPVKGWLYDGVDFSAPEPETQTLNTKITKVKFKQRFTAAERIAIREAAKTDAIAFDFMDLLSDATYIDKSLPETIQSVNYLESQGYIDVGRADIILNTPVTEEEAYK